MVAGAVEFDISLLAWEHVISFPLIYCRWSPCDSIALSASIQAISYWNILVSLFSKNFARRARILCVDRDHDCGIDQWSYTVLSLVDLGDGGRLQEAAVTMSRSLC